MGLALGMAFGRKGLGIKHLALAWAIIGVIEPHCKGSRNNTSHIQSHLNTSNVSELKDIYIINILHPSIESSRAEGMQGIS